MDQPADAQSPHDEFNVQKIQALLTAKDDTSRFVGLALLKTLLDNSEELRNDEGTITGVWQTVSPKFLDRLIKTASQNQDQDQQQGTKSKDMLDLAVSVLHTFVTLLPEDAIKHKRTVGRIPQLVACLLHSSEETTRLVLETLLTLVSQPEGAQEFNRVQDLTPLTEITPFRQLALQILQYAWLGEMATSSDKGALAVKIDKTIRNLVTSFKGTDAVTLLNFLAELLRRLDPETLPHNPEWMPALRAFIQSLVRSRPTQAGRTAWTNVTATLLELYPETAPGLIFLDDEKGKDEKGKDLDGPPISYVMVSLLLVDLRATLPSLLEKLNSPEYKAVSTRLASAFNILSNFIGYLLRAVDDDIFTLIITPDLLLKIRKNISETMSLTVEYLRDRWDASVAGAMGLHPDSRETAVHTTEGSHLALAWDSKGDNVTEDPLIEAGIMALAIWLREDDGEVLRLESTGLTDMFIELYRSSTITTPNPKHIDFRRPILAALEGSISDDTGTEAFINHSGWQVLSDDLISILQQSSSSPQTPIQNLIKETSRGLEIIRILLPIAEAEHPGPREEWMDLVTKISAIYIPQQESPVPTIIVEFQIAALQLVTSLLANSHSRAQRRYAHSMAAILGIASQLKANLKAGLEDEGLLEAVDDVLVTVEGIRSQRSKYGW